jgi:glutathione synthase/RimK-type ligase-like ATP-grasp enzyme
VTPAGVHPREKQGAIALATCARWPRLYPSDARLAEVLRARGHDVVAAPWNGAFAPFEARAVVVRATWDYHDAPDAYLVWLDRLDPRRVFNSPALIRWNLSKAYLLDLAARGAPVPRCREAAADPDAIAGALRALDLRDAVIKPLFGASGAGVERVTVDSAAPALARARSRKAFDRVLVQEFLPEIAGGELAGVFLGGTYSHGLLRAPASGEFRINSQYGGTMEAHPLPREVVDRMTDVLALLPDRPLYARIDGLVRDGQFLLMEVEVNEPALGLDLAAGAAERFAEALEHRLRPQ